MRVLRVCPEMPAFLDSRVTTCHRASFSETLEAYREHGLIFPGGWKEAFEGHGHEVFEVVFADSFSQLQWANELFVSDPNAFVCQIKKASLEEILEAQILTFKPECVIYYTGVLYRLEGSFRNHLKHKFPHIKFVSIWGDQIPSEMTLARFFIGIDAFGACSRGYLEILETLGKPVVLVQSGFDDCYVARYFDKSIRSRPLEERDIEVLFVGNSGYKCLDHVDRYFFISKMLATSPLKFAGIERSMSFADRCFIIGTAICFGVFNNPFGKFILRRIWSKLGRLQAFFPHHWDSNQRLKTRRLLLRARHPFLGERPLRKRFRDRYLGSIFSQREYFELLSRAKIVVNFHRKDPSDYGNLRVWEAIGMGCLLLTDKAFDIADLVGLDTIQNIQTWEDASESCRYFLADTQKAQRMASEAQRHVTRTGTVFYRLVQFSEMIDKLCLVTSEGSAKLATGVVTRFCYDLRTRPLSYDYIFFLQYCVITLRESGAELGSVDIILPRESVDFHERYAWTVNEFNYRVQYLIKPLSDYFPILSTRFFLEDEVADLKLLWDPVSVTGHHSEFYRVVNARSDTLEPIFARRHSVRVALKQFEGLIESYKKIVTLTLRESKQGAERNVTLKDCWPLIKRLGNLKIGVLILPEVGMPGTVDDELPPWVKFVDNDVHRDFDVRLAIYEIADLNIFSNNGPCVASELDPKVRSLMFNLVVPSIPHCTVEYIESQGYKYAAGPSYNSRSVWLWEEKVGDKLLDHVEVLLDVC